MGSCRKMWSLAVAAGLALSALGQAWAQPAAKLPAAIKAKGEVIVGIEGLFAPMEFKNPGSNDLIGFDVDLAKAIGKTLGVKVVFDDQKFDQLINSVTTQRVDFVISAISDSKTRQKTLDFIDYFKSGTQVYTTKAYAGSIKSLDDLSGKTFAIQASTDFFPTIQRWSKEALEAKGKPGVTILPVDSEANARLQVVQGRAQASAISPEVLGWLMKQQPGKFVPVGEMLESNPYGIMFRKDDTGLRDAVHAALAKLFKDGTYHKILAEWKLELCAVDKPTINGATQ